MRLFFNDFLSDSSTILYENAPGKKSYYSRKCLGTKDVYNHAKKVAAAMADDDFKLGGNPETAKKFTFKATSPDIHVFQRYKWYMRF